MADFLPPVPDDPAELAALDVKLERLPGDSPASSPVAVKDILEYLAIESDTSEPTEDNLHFVRTAIVNETHYWIWEFREPAGRQSYATVSVRPNEPPTTGYDENYYDLTPEQFILGDYYGLF